MTTLWGPCSVDTNRHYETAADTTAYQHRVTGRNISGDNETARNITDNTGDHTISMNTKQREALGNILLCDNVIKLPQLHKTE